MHKRPKLGLTLSGGGAKGLAHIGILKAIDSAGLSIDYLTGTSMGAIIGSLYASGYSADSILYIARRMHWDQILSNQSSMRNIIMEEKDEYGKYDLELPWSNRFFRISTGVLEGQELWLKFSELLFPVYKIKKFDSLDIPFKCIATDISTGQAVGKLFLPFGQVWPSLQYLQQWITMAGYWLMAALFAISPLRMCAKWVHSLLSAVM
jgi:NTE family protein